MPLKTVIARKKLEQGMSSMDLVHMSSVYEKFDAFIDALMGDKKDSLDNEVVELIKQLKQKFRDSLDEHMKGIETSLAQNKESVKGEVDALRKLSSEESKKILREVLLPLIRQPKDGKTPKKTELLALIGPLVPKISEASIINAVTVALLPTIPKKEELLTELNKRKITMADVENLSKELREMRKSIREAKRKKDKGGGGKGGGGMGNWVHKRWGISSATTTLTLAYEPAAGGLAHIFRYNGQVQDLDTDYTISGKTITLLFTPQDGTVASIAYVRS